MDILDDMGVSKLSANIFLIELIEVNYLVNWILLWPLTVILNLSWEIPQGTFSFLQWLPVLLDLRH